MTAALAENKELTAALADTQKSIAELQAANAALEAALQAAPGKAAPAAPATADTFKVGNDTYRITAPRFYVGNELLTAADVAQDKKLREHIVTNYPGVVEKI